MKQKLRDSAVHLLAALLLTAGVLVPLLLMLDASLFSVPALCWAGLMILALSLASLHRVSMIATLALLPATFAAWLFLSGGLQTLSDIGVALSLRFAGHTDALPLIAGPAALGVSLAAGLLCWLATLKGASFMPALLLCAAVTILTWLAGRADLLPWLLPGFAAVLATLATDREGGADRLRTLPWALALCLAAFAVTPSSGVVYPPLKEKTDALRQAILDRLFFTEPRDVFSLSSDGWYPQGSGQLGGKPDPSDRPILRVTTPSPVYLRGVALNEYTGRGWTNTTGGRRYLWQSASLAARRARLFDQDLPAESLRGALCDPALVSVRLLTDSASTLFVPQRIRELSPGGDLVPYFSNSSEVFVTRNLQPGDTYSVSAPLFRAGDDGLEQLIDNAAASEDLAWEEVLATYTRLPDHLEEPVRALAAEAVAEADTPYEQALAIQTWLSGSFRYTLEVKDVPASQDFVTRFLLSEKEGYCTYFASAMTVLCRMAGLPARYVEGYLAEPDAGGQALVTGLNGHAWTEVYFRGFGWLTFDATPRRADASGPEGPGEGSPDAGPDSPESPDSSAGPDPNQEPSPDPGEEEASPPSEDAPNEDETPSPSPEDSPAETPTPDPEDNPGEDEIPTPPGESPDPSETDSPESEANDPPSDPPTWPWLALLILLLLIAAAARGVVSSPRFRDRRAASESVRMDLWTREIAEMLRAEGFTRNPGETPMAFTARVDRSARFTVSLAPVGEALSRFHYSRQRPGKGDTALFRDTATLLRSELTAPARLKAALRRFFLPGAKKTDL